MPATEPQSLARLNRKFDPFRLLTFGGSAGGIPALSKLLALLPPAFPIPIVVVQHLGADLPTRLPQVLGFRTSLACRWARDGDVPKPGTIHVASPGANLEIDGSGTLRVVSATKPPLGWPSVDVFLKSTACHLGHRSIAVILSGALYDGAQGISAVRLAGGATMVQAPRTADHPDMPFAAVDMGRAELSLAIDDMVDALLLLAAEGASGPSPSARTGRAW
jgi:two-component system, chemotaxis family, protein-glutamate methylesterase/glutaminase